MKPLTSARLRDWDNEHVWHPFAPMQAYRVEEAPIIERGEGFYLFDVDGNKFLDGISALWCNVHGHQVPEIDQAIIDQLGRVGHTTLLGLSSPPSIELARRLVEITPAGLNKVFYSDSGSTAVEVALKMAFQYHQQKQSGPEKRTLFATVSGAYHGDTIGSVSVGSIDLFHHVYGKLLFETVSVPSPCPFHRPSEMSRDEYVAWSFAEAERIITEHAADLAAFVIEPLVQGASGILVHPPAYLKHIRQLTQRFSIPLIADEVAVGFGRTGSLFACEQEDVQPDFLCLAKGLSGGYLPLAATLTTDEIYDAFLDEPSAGKTFFHGHTFTGNPLACAAAIASLELFQKNNVLENAKEIAAEIESCLQPLQDHPHVGDIRQQGTMVGIELVHQREPQLTYSSKQRMGHQVTLAARKRGVILRPLGDVVVLMPAPAMPIELVRELCQVTIDSICEVTESL